jgi:hypothetical protein
MLPLEWRREEALQIWGLRPPFANELVRSAPKQDRGVSQFYMLYRY